MCHCHSVEFKSAAGVIADLRNAGIPATAFRTQKVLKRRHLPLMYPESLRMFCYRHRLVEVGKRTRCAPVTWSVEFEHYIAEHSDPTVWDLCFAYHAIGAVIAVTGISLLLVSSLSLAKMVTS